MKNAMTLRERRRRTLSVAAQVLWQLLYLLTFTLWRRISQIPAVGKGEILDRERWFWLMDAPASGIRHDLLIADLLCAAALLELLFCGIWLFRFLKGNWKRASRGARRGYLAVLVAAAVIVLLFHFQMRSNFLEMSAYYYLWQKLLPVEVASLGMPVLEGMSRLRGAGDPE